MYYTIKLRSLVLSALLFGQASVTFGNNISVTNTLLLNQNTSDRTIQIHFDVTWENSWRTSSNESNYDGGWIFVKFRKSGTYDWRHCTLDQSQFTSGAGATFVVPNDGKGAFIHRSADGIGNVSFSGNQLTWLYGDDGVLDGDSVEIKVFALEMVYIPEGQYYLGSGSSTETNCFMDGNSNVPYLVSGPGEIVTGITSGQLNVNGGGANGTPIPSTYPNGFNAFWIMKYECSHQQFADFLNHLTSILATTHNTSSNFTGSSYPNLSSSTPDRAYNNLGVAQLIAFADWSGLRPFSELEFEKACRGMNIDPVQNEFPWGTTTIVKLESTQISNGGLPTESVQSPYLANAAYKSTNGASGPGRPVRVGLFARATGSTRELSGATYYGVLNMADNVQEITIRAGTITGQSVNAATHGDGDLVTPITTWQTLAFCLRGSHYNSPWGSGNSNLRTSDREGSDGNVGTPATSFGIRLARTEP